MNRVLLNSIQNKNKNLEFAMKYSSSKPKYTSSREGLLNYSYVADLFKLSKLDKEIDLRLLNDSFKDIDYYLGFSLEYFYTKENLPNELKEAVLILFAKKHSLYKKAADYEKGEKMDDIIEMKLDKGLLDFDSFFNKFSTLPSEVSMLLDKYKSVYKIVHYLPVDLTVKFYLNK